MGCRSALQATDVVVIMHSNPKLHLQKLTGIPHEKNIAWHDLSSKKRTEKNY
jgi:hypothetical protein